MPAMVDRLRPYMFYDVAVRDVVMALAAYTLARLSEARQGVAVELTSPIGLHGFAQTRKTA